MPDNEWIDQLLRDALTKQPSRDYEEFEKEFDAIREGVKARKPRAVIVAAACLAVATSCLRVCSEPTGELSEEEAESVKSLVHSLAGVMTLDRFNYIPAALAALLLRKDPE